MRVKYFLYLLLLIFPFLGAQCIQFKKSAGLGDGGVFKSVDGGNSWKQKTAIPTISGMKSFGGTNVVTIVQDPSDHLALYVGTKEHGMFYTYDGGESWQQPKEIIQGRVNAVAVDFKDKCNIYVATGNRILKSNDCNRSFVEVYRDPNEITVLVVDSYNPAILYAGTRTGSLLKSFDSGASWTPIKDFGGRIIDILFNPKDTRIIYVAVLNRGLWKTSNAGKDWLDLTEGLKKINGALEMRRLIISSSSPETLFLACKYGILVSRDAGQTWEALNLLTKPGSVEIYSLAVDPNDSKRLYYTTASTFYRSQNGGVSWVTKKLPSSRAATYLLVDAKDSNVIYMGMTKIEK